MKISKILLGFAFVLFATLGAYATAKNTAFAPVYVQNGGSCVLADATICQAGPNLCVVVATLPNGTILSPRQIFEDQDPQTPSLCIEPYTRQ